MKLMNGGQISRKRKSKLYTYKPCSPSRVPGKGAAPVLSIGVASLFRGGRGGGWKSSFCSANKAPQPANEAGFKEKEMLNR